ncbi:DUF551 domain-containing protein [Citrobacter portucalensis]|uniref:DUF551 domain-containing protein n=1 Tax=Citrobacter portucalensis TaxID=1639133 RepID=UPI00351D1C60
MTTNNHPAHGPVSLDRLHQISEILSKAAAQSDGGNLGYAMADAVKVIDGAIAAFGAEPVAWRYRYVHTPKTEEHGSPFTTEWKLCDSEDECNPSDCFERQPLYTAPPAPVSVPDAISTRQAIAKMESHEPCDSINVAYKFGWNACRSAMLQTGNSPVTPDGWIPVSERMPNDKDFVWCWGYVSGWTESDGFEAYYDATRNKWWTIDDETVRKVTHWMPLPAAPLWE